MATEGRDERRRPRFFLGWPRILAFLVGLYSRVVRCRILGDPVPARRPVIYVTWHSEEITMLPRSGFTRGTVMVSASRDGDILAEVARAWGYRTIRGSSSKGAAAALLSLRRALERGENIILAVDGPRGPRHEAKPGAFWLAAGTGAWICPVGVAVSSAYVFRKSWSLSRVPLPWARVVGLFGELYRPEGADLLLSREGQSAAVKSLLDKATLQAEDLLKKWHLPCTAKPQTRQRTDLRDNGVPAGGSGGESDHEESD
ncbi:MAG: DUF374 domain-containing protein [Deltaproteobacteria bacterium]|jgi:lysophospholipid acyltransferase (LPLAT)-like uncharacterized protein|nr:DUF374 domain-containing protein [Deltaproteobacteria bacterium]